MKCMLARAWSSWSSSLLFLPQPMRLQFYCVSNSCLSLTLFLCVCLGFFSLPAAKPPFWTNKIDSHVRTQLFELTLVCLSQSLAGQSRQCGCRCRWWMDISSKTLIAKRTAQFPRPPASPPQTAFSCNTLNSGPSSTRLPLIWGLASSPGIWG